MNTTNNRHPIISDHAESESRYHRLRNAAADYYYHVRVENGQIVAKFHESRCEVITGYRADEYAENPEIWMNIVLAEDRALVAEQIDQILSGIEANAIEYRIRRKDGQLRWLRKTIIPYCNSQSILIAYDALLIDVTERKFAELTLRQSEERYRLLFEEDLTGDYVATPTGTILLCNRAFVNIFGFSSHEQAVGSNLAGIYQDPDSWLNLVERLRVMKSIERYERITRRNDGVILHIVENVLGTFDEQGNLIRIKGYIFDDTQSRLEAIKLHQHNLELEQAVQERTRALSEKHSLIEAILNSAFDAIITIDRDGIIHTVNHAAEKIFGYSATDMIGQNVRILMPPPYSDEHNLYLQRFLQTGEKRIIDAARELVARRQDGTVFPIEISISQVDHLNYFTGIIHDISERKQLQAHILDIASEEQRRIGQELHDGIGQELTGLALHAGSLVELLDSITQIESEGRWLSEEYFVKLRNLATTISLRLNDTNKQVRQLAHGIMPVQIDPAGLQTALEELAASIGSQRQVTCLFDSNMPVMVANYATATHLYRIAQEAVNNALRHSQASEIIISLKIQQDQIVLEVKDNGQGIIALKTRDSSADRTQGLGLRTMQYRCGLLGGTFQLLSNKSGGVAVKCRVPIKGVNR